MRRHALAFAVALVAGCDGGALPTPGPTPTPGDMGSGGSGGSAGGGGVDGGGVDGGGGTACTQTQPALIVTAAAAPGALAVDDTDVYFMLQLTTYGDSTLWRAPNSGGAAVEIGSTNESNPALLTVNATAIFTLNSDLQLLRWAKGGGAPLVMQPRNRNFGGTCLADAFGYIYVCNYDSGEIQVVRTLEDGGGSWSVVGGGPFWVGAIAFDPSHLWFDTGHGTFGVPPDGSAGMRISIAPTNESIGSIAVDDAHVYLGGQSDILVADKRDGASFTTFAGGLTSSPALIVRDGNLYALSGRGNGVIHRYALDGSGAVATLASGDIGTMSIRGDYVYYTVPSKNAVWRVCK